MTRDVRPISQTSSLGFWAFTLWSLFCVSLYSYRIRLHLLDDLQVLFQLFSKVTFDPSAFIHIQLAHAFVLLVSFGYLLLFLATGERFLKLWGDLPTRLMTWTWSFALGLAFWGLLAEALALTDLLYGSFAQGLVVAATFLFLALDQKQYLARVWPFEKTEKLNWPWKWIAIGFGLLTLSNLLAPEMSWDAITYQLVLPRYYLDHHGFYPVLGITPSHYPSLGQMLFFWGLIWQDDSIARFFCFWAQLATVLVLMGLGRRWGSPRAGYYAAAFYAFFPYLNIYSTRGYVDLFAGFFAVLGLSLLTGSGDQEKGELSKSELSLIAGVLGVTWALKYNAPVYSLTALAAIFVMTRDRRVTFKFSIVLGLFSMFWFLPWALKSWDYVHDPLFPYLPSWFGAWRWTTYDQMTSWIKFPVEGWQGLVKLPATLFGIFFSNYSGAPNEEVGLSLLIFLPLLWVRSSRRSVSGSFWVVLCLPFLGWLVTSHQLRLMTPVIVFTAFLAGYGLDKALDAWNNYQRPLRLMPILLALLSGLYLFQGLLAQPNPYLHFLGLQSQEEFLDQVMVPKGYVTVNHYLNETLPRNAKVLVLGQQNAYYLQRVSVYDFDYNHALLKEWADQASTPEALYQKFKEAGFEYILYNSKGMMGQVVRLEDLGVDRYAWTPAVLHNYEQFFLRYTQKLPLPVENGYSLYRVGPQKGFSPLPEYLPGTEKLYADEVAQRLGYRKAGALVGKNIPPEIYLKAYDALALHYLELGFPCFQSALADLSSGKISAQQVLSKGKMGLGRNGDEASWLVIQADVQLQKGHFGQAVSFLEKAQYLSPEREDVARNLSVAYYNEQRLDKAVAEAALAVQLSPSSEDDQKLLSQLRSLRPTR